MRLSDLYPLLTAEQRLDLAKRCGIHPGYLWQLSTRWRGKRPRVDLLKKLIDADARLHVADLVSEFGSTEDEVESVEPDFAAVPVPPAQAA